jgi:hypothetical protein
MRERATGAVRQVLLKGSLAHEFGEIQSYCWLYCVLPGGIGVDRNLDNSESSNHRVVQIGPHAFARANN